jgi:Mn-dependent DtxR family transcriptional regulator
MIMFLKEDDNSTLYDINNISQLLKISKSKAHRLIKKSEVKFIPYKNLKLYDEVAFFTVMKFFFIERIVQNGF